MQIEGEDKYDLSEIITSCPHYNKLQDKGKWKGYLPEHDKVWYQAENFHNAEPPVQQFHQCYPGKPGVDTCYNQHIILRIFPSRQTKLTL